MASNTVLTSLPKPKFANSTDEDLLLQMSLKAEDSESAREAFAEFYNRHAQYMLGVCARYQRALGEAGVRDLVEDTLLRVYQRAETYDGRPSLDPIQMRRQVRAWMGKVAYHALVDTLRQSKCDQFSEDPCELDGFPAPLPLEDEVLECINPNQALLEEALKILSDRERDILLTTFAYHQDGRHHQRLPNKVSSDLASRWNTTASHVRVIRKRAYAKIQKYISARST